MYVRSLNDIIKTVCCLLLSATLLSHGISQAELLDRVVAIINDDIITLSELDEYGQDFYETLEKTTPPEELDATINEARKHLLDRLINQRLITHQARQANIALDEEEFRTAYENNLQRLNLTHEELLQKLEQSGMSEEAYKDTIRTELLREKIILYEVRSKIIITEKMMKEYYNKEYSSDVAGGGYHLLQIGFLWSDDEATTNSPDLHEADKARARMRAEKVLQEIRDGANFSEVARKQSELPSAADGGDIGVLQADDMASYMRNAILPLKVGEITPILETPVGFQFFKLLSNRQGEIIHQVPFFEVKDEIQKKLFEQQFKKEFEKWVEKIKQSAYIEKLL